MILALEDRYGPPLSIDTENIPLALHFDITINVLMTSESPKNWFFTDFWWKYANFEIVIKNPRCYGFSIMIPPNQISIVHYLLNK